MKYTFVDIGCGHFATSADIFGTKCNGLLVEPIQEYCNVLPNSNTVKIECSAVSEYNGVRDIFCCVVPDPIYVPKKILDHKQQFERIRKSVAIHGTTSFYGDPIRGIKNAKEIKRTVNTITLKTLFNKYKITEIDYLKIDVEGYEVVVLTQLIDLLRDNTIKLTQIKIYKLLRLIGLVQAHTI